MTTRFAAHAKDGIPGRSGTVAHAVVAEAVIRAAGGQQVSHELVVELTRAACAGIGASKNDRRAFVSALTSASKYLSRLRPTLAEFVVAEAQLRGARPDLVWELVGRGYFFDELKTGRYLKESDVVEQALRQCAAGRDQFGRSFLGVRVISTSIESKSLFFSPCGSAMPLAESILSIQALRTPAQVEVA